MRFRTPSCHISDHSPQRDDRAKSSSNPPDTGSDVDRSNVIDRGDDHNDQDDQNDQGNPNDQDVDEQDGTDAGDRSYWSLLEKNGGGQTSSCSRAPPQPRLPKTAGMKHVSNYSQGNFHRGRYYGSTAEDTNPNDWARWHNYKHRATADMARNIDIHV